MPFRLLNARLAPSVFRGLPVAVSEFPGREFPHDDLFPRERVAPPRQLSLEFLTGSECAVVVDDDRIDGLLQRKGQAFSQTGGFPPAQRFEMVDIGEAVAEKENFGFYGIVFADRNLIDLSRPVFLSLLNY